ncbi:MAG: hypothetical protein LBQ61_00455 [Spirochaetales bacterium]|jgi:hypothetical protein|nr:hypothetical protein [Spirochaetales bacterium]
MTGAKKGIFWLLFLILAGGGIFYRGWLQIHLNSNEYGLLYSKFRDWEVLPPRQFSWRWERLLPTVTTFRKIDLAPRECLVSRQGELPSGEFFSQFMEGRPSFAYEFSFSLTFRLKPEAALSLVREGTLDPENPEAWFEGFQNRLAAEAENELVRNLSAGEGRDQSPQAVEEALKSRLEQTFPEAEIIQAIPLVFAMPDLSLYRHARSEYALLMEARREQDIRNLEAASARAVSELSAMELLGRYGELFTQYPMLLDYLKSNQTLNDNILSTLSP